MESNPFFEKPIAPRAKSSDKLISFLQSIAVGIIVVILLYLFVFTPNQIDGSSMSPTFENDELVLTNRIAQWFGGTPIGASLGFDYQHGDVVTMKLEIEENDIIKRVIGIPGDTVSIENGSVIRNGQVITEDYLPAGLSTPNGTFMTEGKQVVVPTGFLLVIGDNRANSFDSRFLDFELVGRQFVSGKVFLRFWPLETFSGVGRGQSSPV